MAGAVSSGKPNLEQMGRDFNAALANAENLVKGLIQAMVPDEGTKKEYRHDLDKRLTALGELYDEIAGYEPEPEAGAE